LKRSAAIKPSSILVIRRDNIGDLLCTTPLLHALRLHYPQTKIAVLANSYNAPILENNPDIDTVYAYTKAKHSQHSKLVAIWKEWRLFRLIKQARYELIIHANPTAHPRTAKLARYLKAGLTLGVTDNDTDYDICIKKDELASGHHVEQVFSLLKPLGIEGAPGPLTLATRQPYQPNTPTVIGIHLSSRKPDNRWPEANYRALIEQLLTHGFDIELFWAPGSEQDPHHPGDDELARRVKEGFDDRVRLIQTQTLAELVEGLNQCDLMVCPDGGTLHIAAALQKPLVALFGCTDPAVWGPWGTRSETLTGNGKASAITVDAAIKAVSSLTGN
jgi:heptosyltransferase-3